uniref:starch synthase n=1 Tax=Rhizophora mucronata TaxID=61149 RepID=A0A2P2LH60_RHIMU
MESALVVVVDKCCNPLLLSCRTEVLRIRNHKTTRRRRHHHYHNSLLHSSQSSHHLSFPVGAETEKSATSFFSQEPVWPSPNDDIPFWKRDFPSWDTSSRVPIDIDIAKDYDLMHIIHVTAEMAPIAKVGGLGDVVTGLARASLLRGHSVDIMLPFYRCIPNQQITDLALITSYNSYHDGNWIPTNAYRGVVSGIPVIFIDPSNQFFKGPHVYGGSYDELEAYLFFSRACLEWMQVLMSFFFSSPSHFTSEKALLIR